MKTGRRKSRSAEHSKHSDEDEDAYQSAKCYFDLKVRLIPPKMLCQTCSDILNRTHGYHSMQESSIAIGSEAGGPIANDVPHGATMYVCWVSISPLQLLSIPAIAGIQALRACAQEGGRAAGKLSEVLCHISARGGPQGGGAP